MRVILDYRPMIIEARTKNQLRSKLVSGDYNSVFGSMGMYLHNRKNDTIRLVNFQKFRAKHKVETVVNKRTKVSKTVRTLVRAPHWIAYVYTFPVAMVDKATQNHRNFTVTFKTPK